jgi:hypothetical protein
MGGVGSGAAMTDRQLHLLISMLFVGLANVVAGQFAVLVGLSVLWLILSFYSAWRDGQ